MKTIKYITPILALLLIVFSSCSHNHEEGDGHDHTEENNVHSDDDGHDHGEEEHHEEGLHLTKEQAKTIGLEFGSLSSIKVNDFVKATGTLGIPPNAYYSVSSKANGIIVGTKKLVEGNYIEKGAIIAYLENPDFISTQQEYLEAIAQLELKQYDVERQKSLVESNAGITKNLQSAEADVAVLEARTKGLAKQLSFLGISTSNLTPSTIRQQIAIIAPMSGFISKINFHNGMYAQSSESLMDIISSQHIHLELDVFEKDIVNIKEGQKINYSVPALGQTIYFGVVEVIGKEFNINSKTVRIHGHLDDPKPTFLKDLFINAKIYLNDIESEALPEEAIIRDGTNSFIYVADENENDKEIEFEKISVVTGATENGFTSVNLIDTIPEGMEIVTKGAYYVYAQSKAGELEHEH
jgi:cobalt-zinc-cadmium efflux system membrane fusion protein